MPFTPYFQGQNLSLLSNPHTTTLAATMDRSRAVTAASALTSGTVYLMSCPLPVGITVSSMTMFTNTTAKTGGTHGWYVLVDPNMVVKAVTADQTDAATVWGAIGTGYTLPFTAPFTVPATGLYYVGVMVANAAGTQPTFTGASAVAAGISGGTGLASVNILCGQSSSGQTTPPIVGASLSALGSNGGFVFYAYLE